MKPILCFFCTLLFQFAFSQEQNKIQIKISDKSTKELLMGANVQWLNSADGATSDEHGIAYVNAPDSFPGTLVISYVGYITDTLIIKKVANIEEKMQPEIALNEVHVKARKQTNFISSIDPMKTEKINSGELKKAACCNLS